MPGRDYMIEGTDSLETTNWDARANKSAADDETEITIPNQSQFYRVKVALP